MSESGADVSSIFFNGFCLYIGLEIFFLDRYDNMSERKVFQ